MAIDPSVVGIVKNKKMYVCEGMKNANTNKMDHRLQFQLDTRCCKIKEKSSFVVGYELAIRMLPQKEPLFH